LKSDLLSRWSSALRVPSLATLLWSCACACEVRDQGSDTTQCVGPNCDAGLEDTEEPVMEVVLFDAAAAPAPTPEAAVTEVCPGLCFPDDPLACEDFESVEVADRDRVLTFSPAGSGDAGVPAADPTSDAGEDSDASLLAADTGAAAGPDAGVTDDEEDDTPSGDVAEATGGDLDAGSSDGEAGLVETTPLAPVELDGGDIPSVSDPGRYACQLAPRGRELLASCAPAGTAEFNSACSSNRDCGPGLGCVGKAGAGLCLSYCCGGRGTCGAGLFCTERPMLSAGLTTEVMVPVCAFPEQCDLTDPFPCPEGQECSCPAGLACFAVGRDGARACVEPGTGVEGEACPCAAGYFCSPQQQQCLEICRFGTDSCGAAGACQGIGGFPEGVGLCVGLPEAMAEEDAQ
jgi:hypothetical protein